MHSDFLTFLGFMTCVAMTIGLAITIFYYWADHFEVLHLKIKLHELSVSTTLAEGELETIKSTVNKMDTRIK